MWESFSEISAEGTIIKFTINVNSSAVSYVQVLTRWQNDAEFRAFFNDLLAKAPFAAFRWETPPITSATANRKFEFVLMESAGLARTPDPDAFAEHFVGSSGADVVTFANLGNDALMVVPRPIAKPSAYGHLAAFAREAPSQQRHRLWAAVGEAMTRRLGAAPVWLSTAGVGVSWLHVRLDSRPKYYGYAPYRSHG
jgi:uncharacterized protein DUF6940